MFLAVDLYWFYRKLDKIRSEDWNFREEVLEPYPGHYEESSVANYWFYKGFKEALYPSFCHFCPNKTKNQ